MSGDDAIQDLLEAYHEGRLSDADRVLFEERLRTDTALAERLANYRDTRRAIEQGFADEHVRAMLKGVEQRGAEDGHRIDHEVRSLLLEVKRREAGRLRRSHRLRWSIAAAVTGVLAVGAWWLLRPMELPRLAADFAVQEAPLPVFMSAERASSVVLDEVMQAYDMGHDAEALELLADLPASDTVLFYTALVHMRTGQGAAAELDAIIARPGSPYHAKALYHRMILAMRNNDSALAERLWRIQLALPRHPYRERLEALAAETGWKP
ncbi:MAG: hypothetical protein R2817_00700 [Flavobacteriales bacterium]